MAAYHSDSGYLRLVVTRGKGNLGIDPRKCARPGLFIIADEIRVMDTADENAGVSLHVARRPRTPVQCLDPRVKSLNYLNNILARIEASEAGMDEALMLNLEGQVCEGTVDNVFIVSDGVLKTPPLSDGLLAGITRAVILEVAREAGIETAETSLTPDDLKAADECFLTGTGAEMIPVRQIDTHVFAEPRNPLTAELARGFRRKIENYCRRW